MPNLHQPRYYKITEATKITMIIEADFKSPPGQRESVQ